MTTPNDVHTGEIKTGTPGLPPKGTAVVTTPEPATAANNWLMRTPIGRILSKDSALSLLEPVMPKGVSMQRVIYECFLVCQKNEDILKKCSELSIVTAVSRALSTGLEIGKTVHLVPIGDELQCWLDYKGEIELVMAAGVARRVDGAPVYMNEHFRIFGGTHPKIEHEFITSHNKRGEMIGGYAFAELPRYQMKVAYMTLEEVEAIRANSRSWGPRRLKVAPPWYVVKTLIHRVCKTLPKTERLLKVLELMKAMDTAEGIDVGGDPVDERSSIPDMSGRPDVGSPADTIADVEIVEPLDGAPAERYELKDRVYTPSEPSIASTTDLAERAELKASQAGEMKPQEKYYGVVGEPHSYEHLVEGRSNTTVCGREIGESWATARGIFTVESYRGKQECPRCVAIALNQPAPAAESSSSSEPASDETTSDEISPEIHKAHEFEAPFTVGSMMKGKPIGDVDTGDLVKAVELSKKNKNFPDFRKAAAIVLEFRRESGDVSAL